MKAFDPVVANAGRLRILAALAGEGSQPFVRLRAQTGLTDGNLTTHVRRLASAGMVDVEKNLARGKLVTTLHLTRRGREALGEHVEMLVNAMRPTPTIEVQQIEDDGDWVD